MTRVEPNEAATTPRASWAALVLAGGGSERLGTDKTQVRIDGVTALDRVLTAVGDTPAGFEPAAVVLCIGAERPTAAPVRWVREDPPGSGPAAGLVAALGALDESADAVDVAVVLAGDLPMLSAPVLGRLLGAVPPPAQADGARLRDTGGRPQHLLGAYRVSALHDAAAQRPSWAGASMRALLAPMTLVDVAAHGAESLDLDTAGDIDTARRLVRTAAAERPDKGADVSDPDPLADWVHEVTGELDIDPGDVDVPLLLAVARDAAHAVVRPAAPVTTYLLGLAQGRRGGGTAELRSLAVRVDALLSVRTSPNPDPNPDPYPDLED